MSTRPFNLRPHISPGVWLTEHRRYFEYLGIMLEELEALQARVIAEWPEPGHDRIAADLYPAFHRLCRRRDATKDSLVVFSAMTVEATLNYYGVRRFGERHYKEHIERLSLDRKLRLLLLVCDGIDLQKDSELLRCTHRISERRNSLVHPKASELEEEPTLDQRSSRPILDLANEAVSDCELFLRELIALLPNAAGVDPRPRAS